MAVTQKVTLYNNKFTVPPVINAVQNDTDRQVEAYFGDFTLQVGMTGKLSFIRSDGTHYEVSATLNTGANTATAELDQALTQAGVTQAQLKITDSGNVGSTFTFMIKVQPDVAGISVPQDGWSAQEFDQRLTDAENSIDAVEEDVADLQDKEYDYAPVITDTASGTIASFPDGADSYPLKECVIQIDAVQSGSGDPSPTNVRPITGCSSAKVTRTGKNFFSVPSIELGGTNPRTVNIDVDPIPTGQYYFSSVRSGTVTSNYGIQFIGDNGLVAQVSTNAQSINITEPIIRIYAYMSSADYGDGKTLSLSDIQLERGSSASEYEEYVGQTYTISLGSTRYGAVLDAVRGKLTVTKARPTFVWSAGENVTDLGNYVRKAFSVYSSGVVKDPEDSNLDAISNVAKFKYPDSWAQDNDLHFRFNQTGNTVYFWLPENTSASQQLEVCYPLATPIEVDLTPTEITTLLGINNIWADTGDIEVEYCADTKKYIQKLISQIA